jgi:hypothetical protein
MRDPASPRRLTGLSLLAALVFISAAPGAIAATCTADDFAAAVDRSGVALRNFNEGALPKLQEKLKQLKERRGWSDAEFEEKGLGNLRDARSSQFDNDAEELIVKIDTLGRPPPDKAPDCSKLTELDAASLELLAVMKAKSAYVLSKVDTALAEAPAPQAKTAPAPEVKAPPAKPPEPKSAQAKVPLPEPKSAEPKSAEAKSAESKPAVPKWSTQTRPLAPPPQTAFMPPPPPESAQKGYTIDEIREITRGFFGTISTNLGSVIEYAFSTSGRPDGYVLGTEGGGAFLAGVRYGSGMLYLRDGGSQKVYWHGPSIGTDFGAAGSRTMFLIYNLATPEGLMRGFTGIDGSAYFVGGVGITFLKGGDVLMAPIRSGLGFRIGANLGYIRFTPRATWNPF